MGPESKNNLEELVTKIKDNKISVLFGAGMSVSAGIETAGGIVTDLKSKIFKEQGEGFDSQEEFFKEKKWFENDEKAYYEAFGRRFPNKDDRAKKIRKYFQELSEGKLPTQAHMYLANIMNNGHINTALTTNFDRLLEQALSSLGNSMSAVITDHSLSEFIQVPSENSENISLVKLHGDVAFPNLLNFEDEVKKLEKDADDKFRETLRDSGLMVVGYSGSDKSIMDPLKQDALSNGLFWIAREGTTFDNEHLKEIKEKEGFKPIYVENADSFFHQLNRRLGLDEPVPIIHGNPVMNKIDDSLEVAKKIRNRSLDRLVKEEEIVARVLLERVEDRESEIITYKDQETEIKTLLEKGAKLILGQAGEGKSIFMADLAKKVAKHEYDQNHIPVLIDLSKFENKEEFLKELELKKFSDYQKQNSKVVYIFDALDESVNIKQEDLVDKIKELGENNPVIVSSRTTRFNENENEGFRTFYLKKPNTEEEYNEFLEKRLDLDKRDKFLEFINQYDDSVSGNYLLLSFLSQLVNKDEISIDHKIKRSEIYDKIIDEMLIKHQATKSKKSESRIKTVIGDIKESLGKVAYKMIVEEEEFTEGKLPSEIRSDLDSIGLIFKKDEETFYFTHKSFMEYFCAHEINRKLESKKGIKKVLHDIAFHDDFTKKLEIEGKNVNPEWENILLHLSGMTTKGKVRSLVDLILEPVEKSKEKIPNPYTIFVDDLRIANEIIKESEISNKKFTRELNDLTNLSSDAYPGPLIIDETLRKIGYDNPKLVELLDHDDSDVAFFASIALGLRGQYDPRLVELLDHENGQVVENVASTLGHIKHYDPKLVELLDHDDGQVVRSAIFALEIMKHYDPKIVELLEHENSRVVSSAVRALGKINHYDPKLVELLDHEDGQVVSSALEVLEKIRHYNPKIVELLEHEDYQVVSSAVSALGRIKHYDPKLVELLEHEDDQVVSSALEALEIMKHYDPKIVELLEHENSRVVSSAVRALGKINHYDPKLVELLEHEDTEIVNSAVSALGYLDHYDPKLVELLDHENGQVVENVVSTLGHIKHYDPKLVELLEHENSRVVSSVVRALGSLDYYDPKLVELLEHENKGVILSASYILIERGQYDPKLVELLDHEDGQVVSSAIDVLSYINHYDPKIVELLEHENSRVVSSAVRALGKINHYDPKLVELLDHEDGQVVSSALEALEVMKHYDPKIVELLEHEDTGIVISAVKAIYSIKKSLEPKTYIPQPN